MTVVFNNRGYASQKVLRQREFGGRYFGVEFTNPDWEAVHARGGGPRVASRGAA